MIHRERYDAIVVGSGPGGAAVARELAQARKRVLILERGEDHRQRFYYGTHLGALKYCDRHGLLFTEEGMQVVRGIMTGGSTNLFCGCAAEPPDWLEAEYGIDLSEHVDAYVKELQIAPLPEQYLGEASLRIMEAGRTLGISFAPQPKFMQVGRGHPFACSASCMTGCRCGGKWTANDLLDEAVSLGATLVTQASVHHVLVENTRAVGVTGFREGRIPFDARSNVVVLSAGGIGTPRILQRSGLHEAGQGMAMDPALMVYGTVAGKGNYNEPPMTVSCELPEQGFMLSSLIDPWLMYPLITWVKGWQYALTSSRYRRTLGVMVKVTDALSGAVLPDGITRPLTPRDERRIEAGRELARRVLIQAGAEVDTIFSTPLRGTHPCATVRIGEGVGDQLESRLGGLYVCDASVFPRALGRPTVLTILALSRRLGRHLLEAR